MAETTKKTMKPQSEEEQPTMTSKLDAAAAFSGEPASPRAAAAVAAAAGKDDDDDDEAPEETTTHRYLPSEVVETVKQNMLADIARGLSEGDDINQFVSKKSMIKQRLADQRKADNAAAIKAVNGLKAAGHNAWTNFTRGLQDLASSIEDSAVLVNAYGEFVSRKMSVTFSVTNASLRKAGTGLKASKNKKNSYGLDPGEVVPKSTGIGIPMEQHRRKSQKASLLMYFSFENDPEFTFMLGKIPRFIAERSGRQEIDGNEDSGYGLFAARGYE